MENHTVKEGKTIAIIAYLWWIGLIIAFLMNNEKRNSFATFHIRQMIGLSLLSLANYFILREFVNSWGANIVDLFLFVLWIIGFIGALQGEEKRIPLLGDQFQEWFKNVG